MRYLTGNPADVTPAKHGPYMDLGGGGLDIDAGFQNAIDAVRGCSGTCPVKIDIVVLRASGADGYNDYLYAMNGVDSVETLVITDPAVSADPAVLATVNGAEFVFFAGGDQCLYVKYFMDTPIGTSVRALYNAGGAIGGTSAGLAIMGSTVYDACTSANGATSVQALRNPYDRNISFTYGFFDFPHLSNLITDSHFVARDRMGRLLTFLARQIKDGVSATQWGLGVDEATSVVVDANGLATVVGDGAAYLVLADQMPETCIPKKRLTASNYKVWKFVPGQSFDLANRPTTGFTTVSVDNGTIVGFSY